METQGHSIDILLLQAYYKSQWSQREIDPETRTSFGSSSPVLSRWSRPEVLAETAAAPLAEGQASRGRALPYFRFPAQTAPAMVRVPGQGPFLCLAWRAYGSGGDTACR